MFRLQKNYVLCSQCVLYHIHLHSITTLWFTLSPAYDDPIIYVATTPNILSFTILTSKLGNSNISIALQCHFHNASTLPLLLVLTTATTMDIFGTTFTRFEKEFDYTEECMCKKNGVKALSDYTKEKDMMVAKFSVMDCEMMPCVGQWCVIHFEKKKGKRYHHKKWWFYVWIIIVRVRLPLEKVVAVVPFCESKHWWYLDFYKLLVQC